MAGITILGLGPGEWKQLTLEAAAALNAADELWLRTRHHPLVAEMPAHLIVESFDALYEEADEFGPLYERIADEVLRLGRRQKGVIYGVPGHPWVGESTVRRVVTRARAEALPVRIIGGLSFVAPSLAAVEHDALDGLQIADATTLVQRHHPPFDGDRPVLLAQIYSRMVASDVKLLLMELYPADHPVTLLNGVGTREARTIPLPLFRLDQHSDFDARSTLWIPPLARAGSLPHLLDIVAHLRSPEGCPWDQEQDHASLRDALLEEAAEAVEAIDREALDDLAEELGDLLLLVTMHAQIASEGGDFNISRIVATVSEKLVRRHPHVFGTVQAKDSDEVLENWEAIKARERAEKGKERADPFEGIPVALPALLRAQKVARRAVRGAWEPPNPAERFAEWHQAPGDEARLGSLLLALAAEAARRKQSAESALGRATAALVAAQRERPR